METRRAIEQLHAGKMAAKKKENRKQSSTYRKRVTSASCTEPNVPEAAIVIVKLRMCVTETHKRIMNE